MTGAAAFLCLQGLSIQETSLPERDLPLKPASGCCRAFQKKIKPKPDYPLKTLYPRAFQTGLNRLIYYDFTTVE